MNAANASVPPTKKTSKRKTVFVSLLKTATLYLSYQHLIVPKGSILTKEMQQGLWTSIKNAYKFGRLTIRTAAGELEQHLHTDSKKPASPVAEEAGDNADST